jgi:SPP1 gp7 family putative phage head morphogenesis protein
MGVVDDYAAVLDGLEDRVEANTIGMLRRSLDNVLVDLRRAYASYINAVGPAGFDPQGTPIRRPGAYTAGEAASKFRAIQEYAAGFLPPAEIAAWGRRFASDLVEATNLGGEVAATLQQIVTRASNLVPFAGADPFAVRAATEISTAFIQGEAARFRDQITQIVGEGVSRGWGPKRLERQVREALEGSTDPDGITQRLGLRQRAALIARSELANAYVKGSLDHALAEGFGYVRWIAANDERTCPTCASRNTRIYPVDRVVAPAHPRCRCVVGPVPTEAVEEPDPVLRDVLLDGEFWRREYQRGVEAFAAAKKIPIKTAEQQLNRALNTPSASERRLFPDRKEPLPPSVALDAPKGGRTFSEAIEARAAGR